MGLALYLQCCLIISLAPPAGGDTFRCLISIIEEQVCGDHCSIDIEEALKQFLFLVCSILAMTAHGVTKFVILSH